MKIMELATVAEARETLARALAQRDAWWMPEGLIDVLVADVLRAWRDEDAPAWLGGCPGVSKSEIARQLAEREGLPVVEIRVSDDDPDIVAMRALLAEIEADYEDRP